MDRTGAPVSRKNALARYVAALLGPIVALGAYALLRPSGHPGYALAVLAVPYAWALVDLDRQFLHDRLAGTRVVRDS